MHKKIKNENALLVALLLESYATNLQSIAHELAFSITEAIERGELNPDSPLAEKEKVSEAMKNLTKISATFGGIFSGLNRESAVEHAEEEANKIDGQYFAVIPFMNFAFTLRESAETMREAAEIIRGSE